MPGRPPRRLPLAIASLFAAASLACAGLSREPGVCLPNKVDKQAWATIESNGLLGPGENLLAYYDATISLDGTEVSLLTDKRAVYFLDGRTTALAWADIASIERVDVAMGDGFLLTTSDGRAMQIEIAAMNGGDVWERVQMQAWRAAGGGRPGGAASQQAPQVE